MQHIQGDLQIVFDALYELGVIEPVLQQDWHSRLVEIEKGSPALTKALRAVNKCGSNRLLLMEELRRLDRGSLEVLAMEVAREYAGFQTRAEELH